MKDERFVFHLAPCPYCDSMDLEPGSIPSAFKKKTVHFIGCKNCGSRGPESYGFKGAHELWNERKMTSDNGTNNPPRGKKNDEDIS